MHVNYAMLCDYALLSIDGKPSLMGVYSRINTAQFPSLHPPTFLVFEIELDYTELGKQVDVHVQCVDADGSPILDARAAIQTFGKGKIGDRPLLPQILRLPPLRFDKEGKYDINIFLANDPSPKKRVSFEVVVVPPGTPPALPPSPGPASA